MLVNINIYVRKKGKIHINTHLLCFQNVSVEGLVYADLQFAAKQKSKEGRSPPEPKQQDTTDYADIDFSKRAPPPMEPVTNTGQQQAFSI